MLPFSHFKSYFSFVEKAREFEELMHWHTQVIFSHITFVLSIHVTYTA
jgi:hypothetical protein